MLEPVRVAKERKKEKRKRTAKVGNAQASLLTGRTAEQDRQIEECEERIQVLRLQHQIVKAIIEGENEDGIVIIALDLERYGGSRLTDSAWIWLHPDLWEESDAPDADNYTWGYYAQHSPDVERYVRDRAKWFHPIVIEELQEAEEQLEQLKGRFW